jgi:hypothetical protein
MYLARVRFAEMQVRDGNVSSPLDTGASSGSPLIQSAAQGMPVSGLIAPSHHIEAGLPA